MATHYETAKKSVSDWLAKDSSTEVIFLASLVAWSLLLAMNTALMAALASNTKDMTGFVLFTLFFYLPCLFGSTYLLLVASRMAIVVEQRRLEAERGQAIVQTI